MVANNAKRHEVILSLFIRAESWKYYALHSSVIETFTPATNVSSGRLWSDFILVF